MREWLSRRAESMRAGCTPGRRLGASTSSGSPSAMDLRGGTRFGGGQRAATTCKTAQPSRPIDGAQTRRYVRHFDGHNIYTAVALDLVIAGRLFDVACSSSGAIRLRSRGDQWSATDLTSALNAGPGGSGLRSGRGQKRGIVEAGARLAESHLARLAAGDSRRGRSRGEYRTMPSIADIAGPSPRRRLLRPDRRATRQAAGTRFGKPQLVTPRGPSAPSRWGIAADGAEGHRRTDAAWSEAHTSAAPANRVGWARREAASGRLAGADVAAQGEPFSGFGPG